MRKNKKNKNKLFYNNYQGIKSAIRKYGIENFITHFRVFDYDENLVKIFEKSIKSVCEILTLNYKIVEDICSDSYIIMVRKKKYD